MDETTRGAAERRLHPIRLPGADRPAGGGGVPPPGPGKALTMTQQEIRSEDDRIAAQEAQQQDASVQRPDAGAVDTQDMAAADGLTASEETGQHYREMTQRGAHQRGEGAVE